MAGINMNIVCRCCHVEGEFEMLDTNDSISNYSTMLEETFNIKIYNPRYDLASYKICEKCKFSLQEAYAFKKQVLFCEEKFRQCCQNEIMVKANPLCIKFEVESDNDDFQLTTDMKDDTKSEFECKMEKPITVKLEDSKDKSNTEMKIFETEHTFSDDLINVADNLQPNSDSAKKSITIIENTAKKAIESKINSTKNTGATKKGVKKKGKSGHKVTPLISRQNIDESLIETRDTESGLSYSCIKCDDKSYNNRGSILTHLAYYHTGVYKCPKCDHLCSNGYELRDHYRAHFKSLLSCTVCGLTCNTRYGLNEHKKKHLSSTLFMCDLCPKTFKHKKSLKIHMFVHTGGKPKHLCDSCGKCFNDKTNLRIHERAVHLKLRPFTCDHCKATYTAKKHLMSHIITKHLDMKEYGCNVCGLMFATTNSRVKHEATHTNVFKCCDTEFGGKRELTAHIKKFNCDTKNIPNDIKKYKYFKSKSCEICKKVFATKFTWSRHISQKHNSARTRDFTCDICDQKFYDSSSLYRHKYKRHIPNVIQDKVKCNVCHKSFRYFEKHMLSHLETPYSCNVCGKGFSEVSARNHHAKYVHSGQRFVCNICSKGYKEKGALARHMTRAHDIKYGNDFDDSMSSYIINKGQYQ